MVAPVAEPSLFLVCSWFALGFSLRLSLRSLRLCVEILFPIGSKFASMVLRRRGGGGAGDFVGEVAFARADLHVGQSRNVHGDFAVRLGLGLGIGVRLVAQDVLGLDLAADAAHSLDDAIGDLRGVAAGADGEGVVAVVGGVRKIAGHILVKRIQRVFDVAAGLVGQALQHVLGLVGEAERHGADGIDRDKIALGELQNLFQVVGAGVVVAVAHHDDDAPRFVGLAFDQLAPRAGQVNGVIQRCAAAGLHLADLVGEFLGVPGGFDHDIGGIAVGNQVTGEAFVAGQQVPHQFQNGILVSLPVDARIVAQVDQEAGHDGLFLFMAEKLDVLRLALVEHAEILLHEVGNEAAFVVGHGDRDDDFGGGSPELYGGLAGLLRGGWRRSGLLGYRGQAEKQAG